MKIYKLGVLFFLSFVYAQSCFSMDIIRWNHGSKGTDTRRSYKVELITQALEKTTPLYGAYRIVEADQGLVTKRAVQQVKSGRLINIFMAVTSPEWESKTIPIRIPIRRGILNYRLLAINKESVSQFKKVDTSESLQKFKVGLRRGWATVALMDSYDFPVLQTPSLDGLYQKLSRYEIDYIPRGINEIFDEVESHRQSNPDLIIDPSVAIYTQAPYYIFVSPTEKRLAERLEKGLEMMIADNSLKALFDKYYADKIAKAKINKRNVIYLNNPYLSPKTPLERKELWFEYDDKL